MYGEASDGSSSCGFTRPLYSTSDRATTPLSPGCPVVVGHRIGPLPVAPRRIRDGELRTEARSPAMSSSQSFTVSDQSLLNEIRNAHEARIITITISVATSRENKQHQWLVVEREVRCSSVNKSDWSVLLPESPIRSAAGHSAATEWKGAISEWSAKKMLEPATERWDLSGSIADGLGCFRDQYHQLMLGEPVDFLSRAVGLPPSAATNNASNNVCRRSQGRRLSDSTLTARWQTQVVTCRAASRDSKTVLRFIFFRCFMVSYPHFKKRSVPDPLRTVTREKDFHEKFPDEPPAWRYRQAV